MLRAKEIFPCGLLGKRAIGSSALEKDNGWAPAPVWRYGEETIWCSLVKKGLPFTAETATIVYKNTRDLFWFDIEREVLCSNIE